MIPLKDDIPAARFPLVNTALIVANCVVFLFETGLGQGTGGFIHHYGIVPARVIALGVSNWYTVVTAMFLHGGWEHIIGNMLYLFIFGDNVEDALGHVNYILFYLACGAAAAAAQVLSGPGSQLPTVGASGAIAGVLAAYLVLYPRAGVLTLIPLGFFFRIVRVPAVFVLGFWIVLQVVFGLVSLPLSHAAQGGIAWFAHIGGFAAGLILVKPLNWMARRRSISA